MKVSEVMTIDPRCCLATDTLTHAAQIMQSEDVGSVPVVLDRQTKRLTGIVTDRDIVIKAVANARDAHITTVDAVMTRDPITCQMDDDLEVALRVMSVNQVRRVPVVNEQHEVIGIVAQADIATRGEQPSKTAAVVEEISQP